MQFDFDDDLAAVRDLAEQIFTDQAEVDRVVRSEQAGGHDPQLWQVLADAGLLGIAVPEKFGGAGMGMLGLVALLEQQGRKVAPVPLAPVLSTAVLPLVQFGSTDQVEQWLPGLLDGSVVVTGAFDAPPGQSAVVRAEQATQGWTLHGELPAVPAAPLAAAVVIPVRLPPGEVRVALVPTDRAGVTITDRQVTNWESTGAVTLAGVSIDTADLLDGDGAEIVNWTRRRARVALAAVASGVCAEALRTTAEYTSQREQFGRPLSTNQAVVVRAADAHLDTESIRLCTLRAAWLMDLGREDEAEAAALVAKWWASRGGLRVVHATQHLHGGIGADVDYPIHRYFLWGRQLAFSLGSADAVAAELGDVLETGVMVGAPA